MRILSCLLAALLTVPAVADETTVFKNVRVITMTDAGVIDETTVVVTGDRITAVGTGTIPEGARVIDGEGLTLMPGLADMHVHYMSNTPALYPANSVTSVRNLWGSSEMFIEDYKAKAGHAVAPHVYTSGSLMDGPEPIWGDGSMKIESPEQAIGAIDSQRTTGYSAIKLYEGITPEIYRAAVAAAKERDMQVWTHTPGGLTVDDLIELGVDSLEHLDDVSEIVSTDPSGSYFNAWKHADTDKMRELAERSAKSPLWHSPTLAVIIKRYEYGADPEAYFDSEASAYIGSNLESWWRNSAERIGPYTDERRAAAAKQLEFVKLVHDAGGKLLVGTDTPNPFVAPGFAIHDELALFVEAGIPVAKVLRMATAGAAEFFREGGEWGVVAEGARADLVLLDGDPLSDLDTLRRPVGTMVNGHWYDRKTLDAELTSIRETFEAAAE